MAYDERLAERIKKALAGDKGVGEIKMMGGLCFTLNGNMCCGVINDDLVVRAGTAQAETLLMRPHARPMDFTGRPLRGFVYVGPEGWREDRDLKFWIRQAVEFASSLPPKVKERPRARRSGPARSFRPLKRRHG